MVFLNKFQAHLLLFFMFVSIQDGVNCGEKRISNLNRRTPEARFNGWEAIVDQSGALCIQNGCLLNQECALRYILNCHKYLKVVMHFNKHFNSKSELQHNIPKPVGNLFLTWEKNKKGSMALSFRNVETVGYNFTFTQFMLCLFC